MPSIAQTLLDKYNGVVDVVQSAVSNAADKGIAVLHAATEPHVMSESQLKNKEMLRNTLRNGSWMIDYTKVDGTSATMECTLDPALMPSQVSLMETPKVKKPEQSHLLAVYATDRQGWRSFVTNNVTKIYKKL